MSNDSSVLAQDPYSSPKWQAAYEKINSILDETVKRSAHPSGRSSETSRDNLVFQPQAHLEQAYPQDNLTKMKDDTEKANENIYTVNFNALEPSNRITFAARQQHPSLTQFDTTDMSLREPTFQNSITPEKANVQSMSQSAHDVNALKSGLYYEKSSRDHKQMLAENQHTDRKQTLSVRSLDTALQTHYHKTLTNGENSDYQIKVNGTERSFFGPQILSSNSKADQELLSPGKQRASDKALNRLNMDRSILNAQYEYARSKALSPVRLTQPDNSQIQLNQSKDAIAVRKALFFGEAEALRGKSHTDITNERKSANEANDQSRSLENGRLRATAPGGFYSHHVHKESPTVNLVEEKIKEIERSFLLKLKAEDEENYNDEAIHCMYIERRDIENFVSQKRAQSPENKSLQSLNEPDARSQPNHKRSPIKGPKTYEQVWEDYPDRTRYEGDKYIGKRHGKGAFYYREGYKYEGNWQDDFMSGFGVLWFSKDRKLYEGEWQRGKFHGPGVLFNHTPRMIGLDFDGSNFEDLISGWIMFEGSFKNGKKNGLGTVVIANGDNFVGNFVEDVVEGEGSYSIINGRTILGVWKQNRLFEEF